MEDKRKTKNVSTTVWGSRTMYEAVLLELRQRLKTERGDRQQNDGDRQHGDGTGSRRALRVLEQ